MDRIAALRNVEDALADFEAGEADLARTEERVLTVLRTYATEFDGEDGVFRAAGPDGPDAVVVAPDRAAARERIRTLTGEEAVGVERLD